MPRTLGPWCFVLLHYHDDLRTSAAFPTLRDREPLRLRENICVCGLAGARRDPLCSYRGREGLSALRQHPGSSGSSRGFRIARK